MDILELEIARYFSSRPSAIHGSRYVIARLLAGFFGHGRPWRRTQAYRLLETFASRRAVDRAIQDLCRSGLLVAERYRPSSGERGWQVYRFVRPGRLQTMMPPEPAEAAEQESSTETV